jgi:hypothetical protein
MRKLPRCASRNAAGAAAAALCLLVLGGCSPGTGPADGETATKRVETFGSDAVRVTLTIEPSRVRLDRNVEVTIVSDAPEAYTVDLPSLDDRLTGFTVTGAYDAENIRHEGRIRRTRHIQLAPSLSDEYRIAPMAITYSGGWLATEPIVLEARAIGRADDGSDVSDIEGPKWIYPPFRTTLKYLFVVLVIAALAVWVRHMTTRVRQQMEAARLAPHELAMQELAALLARRLPENDQIKAFYLELTMIVRRYIERAHHVRAPEQTTQEFLDAVSRDPRFAPDIVVKLQAFLESADLVKYAAFEPTGDAVDQATRTARDYIETDAQQARAA